MESNIEPGSSQESKELVDSEHANKADQNPTVEGQESNSKKLRSVHNHFTRLE